MFEALSYLERTNGGTHISDIRRELEQEQVHITPKEIRDALKMLNKHGLIEEHPDNFYAVSALGREAFLVPLSGTQL